MALNDDLKAEVERIFATRWNERDGRVVPDPEDVSLDNEAVKLIERPSYTQISLLQRYSLTP